MNLMPNNFQYNTNNNNVPHYRPSIMYCISSFGHGRGGHFHSLKVTAQALSKHLNIHVTNFGLYPSPVVKDICDNVVFLRTNGINFISTLIKFLNRIHQVKPDAIHAFDTVSFAFARLAGLLTKVPVVLTKCGGPNPNNYFPTADNLIVYSEENKKFFKRTNKFQNTIISTIPNRVCHVTTCHKSVEKMKSIAGDRVILLRISRISQYYQTSLLQTISLSHKLKAAGIDHVLFIVGTIQDRATHNRLLSEANTEYIVFLSDPDITMNSSKVIEAASVVIGTGRSLMEATSKGKIILTPTDKGDLPVLVETCNFDKLFETNFSERNSLELSQVNESFSHLIDLLTNDTKQRAYNKFSYQLFDKYFSIDSATSKYVEFYSQLKRQKHNLKILDCMISTVLCIKYCTTQAIKSNISKFSQ